MSYRQTIRRTISIHYSGTVSYPASKSGGTVGYSGVVHEDVEVNVDVDTEPFDKSVDNCNQHVNLLTGAVVVAEAEQTKSIKDNAIKVGNAIIGGFFKTVQSEISQSLKVTNKQFYFYGWLSGKEQSYKERTDPCLPGMGVRECLTTTGKA